MDEQLIVGLDQHTSLSTHLGKGVCCKEAIFLYFEGPEGMTWEYSHGVRLVPEDSGWTPRTFDPSEPDFIDMWRGAIPAALSTGQVRA